MKLTRRRLAPYCRARALEKFMNTKRQNDGRRSDAETHCGNCLMRKIIDKLEEALAQVKRFEDFNEEATLSMGYVSPRRWPRRSRRRTLSRRSSKSEGLRQSNRSYTGRFQGINSSRARMWPFSARRTGTIENDSSNPLAARSSPRLWQAQIPTGRFPLSVATRGEQSEARVRRLFGDTVSRRSTKGQCVALAHADGSLGLRLEMLVEQEEKP
jgi:hypothetical protein